MSHFTKQVQDGQKQSKFFPSASLLLSIKAGWPCHGKISRRFILSSQCNGLIHCANDDLSMSPQGKIKLAVVFYFTSNASYQTSQLTLTTFSYYWLRSRGWKKWPRGKKLFSFPLKKWILNRKWGWWRIQFYSLVQNMLSSLLAHRISEYFSLGRDIRRSSGPSPCLKQVQLEQAAHSVFEYHQGRRVKNLSGPPVSMTPLTVTAFFFILRSPFSVCFPH